MGKCRIKGGGGKAKWVAIGVAAIAVIAAVAIVLLVSTGGKSGPKTVVEQYLNALYMNKDYRTAYYLESTERRGTMSLSEYEELSRRFNEVIKSSQSGFTILESADNGVTGWVTYRWNGQKKALKSLVVKEGDEWKVGRIDKL